MLFKPKLTPVRVGRNIPQFQNPPDLSSINMEGTFHMAWEVQKYFWPVKTRNVES